MMKWIKRIALVLAIAFLVMTFVNASWIAPFPKGRIKLMAQHGVSQQFGRKGLTGQDCTATRIEKPVHEYLENTLPSLQAADGMGATYVAADLAMTADGQFVLFGDKTLDCRTNGKGPVSAKTLAELRTLDAGYGYSADGGKSFPLRGRGVGYISSLDQALTGLPAVPIIFNLGEMDAAQGQKLADALTAAHRDVDKIGDAFTGSEAAIAPLRQRFAKAWTWSPESARACTSDYMLQGWLGLTPASCKNGTILIPLDQQWAFAGWPNRLVARMDAVGAKVVLTGPRSESGAAVGLDLPEQIRDVPASFTGVLWVEDIWVIGPAMKPAANHRNGREEEETAALVEARRKARE